MPSKRKPKPKPLKLPETLIDKEGQSEVWVDDVRHPSMYLISNFGRVWSKSMQKLINQQNKKGYMVFAMKEGGRGGKAILKRVHVMVAQAFLPERSEKQIEVNHENGIKSDNHYRNLRWVTKKENAKHAVDTGLFTPPTFGSIYPDVELTRFEAMFIQKNYIPRCKKFGVRALAIAHAMAHPGIVKAKKLHIEEHEWKEFNLLSDEEVNQKIRSIIEARITAKKENPRGWVDC